MKRDKNGRFARKTKSSKKDIWKNTDPIVFKKLTEEDLDCSPRSILDIPRETSRLVRNPNGKKGQKITILNGDFQSDPEMEELILSKLPSKLLKALDNNKNKTMNDMKLAIKETMKKK